MPLSPANAGAQAFSETLVGLNRQQDLSTNNTNGCG